jgi:hypothetical protein
VAMGMRTCPLIASYEHLVPSIDSLVRNPNPYHRGRKHQRLELRDPRDARRSVPSFLPPRVLGFVRKEHKAGGTKGGRKMSA